MSPPPKITRRTLTFGGLAAAGAAAIAGAIYEVPRLFKRRARGEYADLVNRLDDPDQAVLVGQQILQQMYIGPSPDANMGSTERIIREAATDIRAHLSHELLQDLINSDISAGKTVEAGGWVMPVSLGALCAMAAYPE